MGVKKAESGERNGGARKRHFMRDGTEALLGKSERRRGKDNGRRKVA